MNRIGLYLLVTVMGIAVMIPGVARAQTETALYSFPSGGSGGSEPIGSLINDSAGNAYGTASVGGGSSNCFTGCGVVFKISLKGYSVLHTFTGSPSDGSAPRGTLLRDKSGNLYGTTVAGGTNDNGTVFEITASGTESILWSFGPAYGGDGAGPLGSLAMDAQGNLYGTTVSGGAYGAGTVFEITSGTESILYSFRGKSDGGSPLAGPILDQAGNLYGTTSAGGNGYGTVFELSPSGEETVLHSFRGWPTDGDFPSSSLVLNSKGSLFGTTQYGGTQNKGTVFGINPSTNYGKVLYNFGSQTNDGLNPFSGVVLDSKGNIYGTTVGGGGGNGGTLYSLTPSGTETILYIFGAKGDGVFPYGGVILDVHGNVYGTTWTGGKYGQGTIFEITP